MNEKVRTMTNICGKCKQPIGPGEPTIILRWGKGETETEHRDCTAAALARMEDAINALVDPPTRRRIVQLGEDLYRVYLEDGTTLTAVPSATYDALLARASELTL